MKIINQIILSILLITFSNAAFAGQVGGSGGVPPGKTLENLGERLEVDITPNDMLRAIDAAMLKKDLPFVLEHGGMVNLKPESFDFARRELQAKIKGLSGSVLLREVTETE